MNKKQWRIMGVWRPGQEVESVPLFPNFHETNFSHFQKWEAKKKKSSSAYFQTFSHKFQRLTWPYELLFTLFPYILHLYAFMHTNINFSLPLMCQIVGPFFKYQVDFSAPPPQKKSGARDTCPLPALMITYFCHLCNKWGALTKTHKTEHRSKLFSGT